VLTSYHFFLLVLATLLVILGITVDKRLDPCSRCIPSETPEYQKSRISITQAGSNIGHCLPNRVSEQDLHSSLPLPGIAYPSATQLGPSTDARKAKEAVRSRSGSVTALVELGGGVALSLGRSDDIIRSDIGRQETVKASGRESVGFLSVRLS
jgi:hypothetical protein